MAIPDISTLTEGELSTLIEQAGAYLSARRQAVEANAAQLRVVAADDVDRLAALIGPPPATATEGTESLNELLKIPRAAVNADPHAVITALAKIMRKQIKAQIPVNRLVTGRTEAVTTGE